jgi:hypothetical protein
VKPTHYPEYAIFLYANKDDITKDVNGSEREEYDRYSEEMQEAGSMIAAFALESYDTATSIRSEGITDGPFIEAKEVVLGFYVIEAPDLDAALAEAQRNPIIKQGGGVEVRPVEGFVVRPTSE